MFEKFSPKAGFKVIVKRALLFVVFLAVLSVCDARPPQQVAPSQANEKVAVTAPPSGSAGGEVSGAGVPGTSQQIRLSFSPVVKKTAPAVVSIYALKVKRTAYPISPLFEFFFGGQGMPGKRLEKSLGSGTIIRPDGSLITNWHVVEGSEQIKVVLSDKREFDAHIVVHDKKADLAVLALKEAQGPFPYLPLANSEKTEVGDLVLAIGNPFGFSHTVTNGIISAVGRTHLKKSQAFIQTDAAINQGNSGGALINLDGELLGVCTFIISRSGGSDSIGFAIPANMLKPVIDAIDRGGRIARSWSGVKVQSLTKSLADSLGLEHAQGVIITRVYPGSPGAVAKLQEGDVITHVDALPVDDDDAFEAKIGSLPIATTSMLTIVRKGQKNATDIPLLLQAPPEVPSRDERTISGQSPLLGARLANLSPAFAQELDLDWSTQGVIVTAVADGSPAAMLSLEEGDIILKINGNAIASSAQADKVLQSLQDQSLQLVVRRGTQTFILTIAR